MNVWLFAGCMLLVAVLLNLLLLFGHQVIKKLRSKKMKRQNEMIDQ
ncbi:hypothetical protein QUF88_00515 [Bacillus sp. DX1.1]|nr:MULTISPECIES: hypothetical protein [unclassified Bacillus (in: firmicutes)]MDM5152541.1 hypothetical protein [Bacillus sp. DX1.1]WJE84468.1 hypothetical protein QRE67_27515 [Bacillus sp. DX3.1]